MPVEVPTQDEFLAFKKKTEDDIAAINNKLNAPVPQPPIPPTPTPSPTTITNGLYNPLYVYPTGAEWNTVIQKAKENPNLPNLVTINPQSGVGTAIDQNYVTLVNNLHAVKVKVIGYVYTSYGGRSQAACKAEIDKYFSWYKVDGIFYDEMNNTAGGAQYYKDLTTYTKTKKADSFTMGNPGADTRTEYIGTCDTIIIYEREGLPSLDYLKGWHLSHDKKNFAIIPHTVPTLDTNFVKEAKKYVGWIYVTNDTMTNPWNSLCSYYNQLVTALVTP